MSHTKQSIHELVFLYKVMPGVSSSYAFEVAAAAGLDSDIIQRARQIFENIKDNRPVPPLPHLMYRVDSGNHNSLEAFLADLDIPEPDI